MTITHLKLEARVNLFICLSIFLFPSLVLGQDAPWTSLNEEAWRFLQKGEISKAITKENEKVKFAEKKYGEQHPKVAEALSQLALLFRILNMTEKAVPLYTRALKIRTASLGPSHSAVAVTLHDLGETYQEIGKYDKAASYYERALKVMEKAKGPHHPDVATVLHNVSILRSFQGQETESESLMERAIAIKEKSPDPYGNGVVGSYIVLGDLYRQHMKYVEADGALKKALSLERNVHENSYTAGIIFFAMGNLETERKNLSMAEKAYQQSLDALHQVYGFDAPSVIPVMLAYVKVLRRLGREVDVKNLEERIESAKMNQGEEIPNY